jgi:hypothetical protein
MIQMKVGFHGSWFYAPKTIEIKMIKGFNGNSKLNLLFHYTAFSMPLVVPSTGLPKIAPSQIKTSCSAKFILFAGS